MSQSNESLSACQYTRGMVFSYVALTIVLIKSGAIRPEDVVKELDMFIKIIKEYHPDNIELIETMKLTKDMILNLYPENEPSDNTPSVWVSDFIGEA